MQVAPGSADLTPDQFSDLSEQSLPGQAPPVLARNPPPDGTGIGVVWQLVRYRKPTWDTGNQNTTTGT